EITSPAVAPMRCNPPTKSSMLAPSPISRRFAALSLVFNSVSPTTSVFPDESGAGWDTEYSVEICTENPPCRMDTAPSRTSFPITMVPVRSLTTTRARRCTFTTRFSILAKTAVRFATPVARDGVSEFAVDGVGNAARRRKIRLAQKQRDWRQLVEIEGQISFRPGDR